MRTAQLLTVSLALALSFACDDAEPGDPAPIDMIVVDEDDAGAEVDAGAEIDAGADVDAGPSADTPADIAANADMTRFGEHLAFVAQPRPHGGAHWQAVQDRCATVFADAGFTVERQAYRSGTNVIGVLPGVSSPEDFVLLTAHYDGHAGCANANANATGVAAVLDAAAALGQHTYAKTVVVACFDERNLASGGARAWIGRHGRQGRSLSASLHLESIGHTTEQPNTQVFPAGFELLFEEAAEFVAARDNRGDFIASIGDDSASDMLADLNSHAVAIDLPLATIQVPAALRADSSLSALQRGDHRWFWLADWPAVQLTDTGPFRDPGFSCEWAPDDVDRVDVGFAHQVTQAATFAIASQAGVEAGAPAALDTTTDPDPQAPVCDLLAQDCPEGQKCVATAGTGSSTDPYVLRCIPRAETPIQPGRPGEADVCTRDGGLGLDDCAVGSFCTFWGEANGTPQRRICLPYCGTDADCPTAGDHCVHLFRTHSVGMCAPPCSPLDVDACPGGRCVALGDGGHVYNRDYPRYVCLPRTGEAQAEGEPCSNVAGARCLKGLRCLEARGVHEPVCTRWCAADGDCADGQACQPSGAPGIGWCQPEL